MSQKTFINTLYSLKINNNNNSRCNEIRCTIQENIIQTFFANNIVMYNVSILFDTSFLTNFDKV